MKIHCPGTKDERIQYRCRIEGKYLDENFVYEDDLGGDGSGFYWVVDKDPSTFWWREGNLSCDCNRYEFLPPHLKEKHNGECGEGIKIKRIIPIEISETIPTLDLNEY